VKSKKLMVDNSVASDRDGQVTIESAVTPIAASADTKSHVGLR
jgi:hypothetical protein